MGADGTRRRRVSSPAATGDEEKMWLKKKKRKTYRGGDGHPDPQAREGQQNTLAALANRQAG
jgi:hypothetical protein